MRGTLGGVRPAGWIERRESGSLGVGVCNVSSQSVSPNDDDETVVLNGLDHDFDAWDGDIG